MDTTCELDEVVTARVVDVSACYEGVRTSG